MPSESCSHRRAGLARDTGRRAAPHARKVAESTSSRDTPVARSRHSRGVGNSSFDTQRRAASRPWTVHTHGKARWARPARQSRFLPAPARRPRTRRTTETPQTTTPRVMSNLPSSCSGLGASSPPRRARGQRRAPPVPNFPQPDPVTGQIRRVSPPPPFVRPALARAIRSRTHYASLSSQVGRITRTGRQPVSAGGVTGVSLGAARRALPRAPVFKKPLKAGGRGGGCFPSPSSLL